MARLALVSDESRPVVGSVLKPQEALEADSEVSAVWRCSF
jgi:hypothetical protein